MTQLLLPLVVAIGLVGSGPDLWSLEATFERIVAASRGEVGVALIHVETGARLAIHGDQRFPMASVYKVPIALELLTQASLGQLSFDRQIAIGPSDIRACCTLSRRHPNGGVTLTAGERSSCRGPRRRTRHPGSVRRQRAGQRNDAG